jgi:hypothetical protein
MPASLLTCLGSVAVLFLLLIMFNSIPTALSSLEHTKAGDTLSSRHVSSCDITRSVGM